MANFGHLARKKKGGDCDSYKDFFLQYLERKKEKKFHILDHSF
jgi:predicted CopG family antitoxin